MKNTSHVFGALAFLFGIFWLISVSQVRPEELEVKAYAELDYKEGKFAEVITWGRYVHDHCDATSEGFMEASTIFYDLSTILFDDISVRPFSSIDANTALQRSIGFKSAEKSIQTMVSKHGECDQEYIKGVMKNIRADLPRN